ncbi:MULTISPECIES: MotA/TolQ/ExbB proton channel family protein [Pseudomonas]|jgi:biopolymer transport protein ExbB|uniref:MotA/TolQ/ExbB proton channel n=9 Tax=Pseudomonas syringae group TaxID=136849 RepID=F3G9Z4_PSESJ|nr:MULTISPECIES: MotA/TolQ/ExbB proton channel family protein [Pseudomonas]EGH31102.1 MotA/TolQ/ExbB proton channel [Pseudomonas syringae pv. japonica str. M301072]EGH43894.1 MotA/TolQ/ExbB proton channel [Pseudomonas syringae pv. pisi str. 1704B]AVX26051.1 MotA/TolQ/ExbB proton channel family protein [Pseudomonas syringae pv. atrofaciens]AZG88427.1 MotA/TolQ/ExbB proton channel family protein [Pseudomonas syringae pv. pisi str. PP1]EPF68569.1 Ferric siderophore uptake system, MotA/TolQ/ExbB f
MNTAYSVLITQSSMALLVIFSLVTWALLLGKTFQHWRLTRQNRRYATQFWAARDLKNALHLPNSEGSLARLTDAGAQALAAPHDSPDLGHSWNRQDLLERSLRQQIHKERRRLESGMILLASIGSTAPFIGLFGTVFGIIHALSAISQAKSASIAVVAGPIGEALVATGVGIAVAVPAVLAYNFFGRRLKLVIADLEEFAVDFLNLSQRNAFRLQPDHRDKTAPSLKGVS